MTEENRWKEYLKLMQERPELFRENSWLSIEKDPEVIRQYERDTGRKIGVVYKSDYHMMVVDLVRGENGTCFCYERLIPTVKEGAVVTVPVFEGKFVLLRQYRHAIREWQYAFPRGFGEPGISAEENVRKELLEEIGADVRNVTYLGEVVADSGIGSNKVKVYGCEIMEPKLKKGYEGIAEIQLLTEEVLDDWIANGRINDGFTLSGYNMYRVKKNS